MPRITYCVLSVALCLTLFSLPVFAVEGSDATVSGSGAVTLRPVPTRLRMVMALRAHGKTPQVAIENLKARREAAVAGLKDLKADADSISFGAPRVAIMGNENSLTSHAVTSWVVGTPGPQFYPPPRPSYAAPPNTPVRSMPAKERPILFIATKVLRAEWPLADEGPDRLAAAVAEIQEKVRSAKLEEGKAEQNLSAEEQELIEEAQMGLTPTQIPSSPFLASPTGPVFVYVATFSDVQRKTALAKAFVKAKNDAAELAEAAGMRLGPITSLSGGSGGSYHYSPHVSYGMDESLSPLKKLSEKEVVSKSTDALEFSVVIRVQYRLLPPGAKP